MEIKGDNKEIIREIKANSREIIWHLSPQRAKRLSPFNYLYLPQK
jgi:hypothetical protein